MIFDLVMDVVAMGPGPETAEGEGPHPLLQFIPIIALLVMMYVLLFLPAQKKQKEHDKLVKETKTGDKVIAAGEFMAMWPM